MTPQIQALEDELRSVSDRLATGVRDLGCKLDALRNIELPVTAPVLDDYLRGDIERRDLEGRSLARFTRLVRGLETQEEILSALLDAAATYSPRVALYTVRSGWFKGWSSRGFSGEAAAGIGAEWFPQSDAPGLADAVHAGPAGRVSGRGGDADVKAIDELPEALACVRRGSCGPWLILPLYVLERPVAVLLAGEASGEGAASRPQALSVITDCVALRLENIALKILKNLGEAAPAAAAVPPPAVLEPLVEPLAAQPEVVASPADVVVGEIEAILDASAPAPTAVVEPVEPPASLAVEAGSLDLGSLTAPIAIPEPADAAPAVQEPLPVFDVDLGSLTAPIAIPEPAEVAPPPVDASSKPDPLAGLNLVFAPSAPVAPSIPVESPLNLVDEFPVVVAAPAPPVAAVVEALTAEPEVKAVEAEPAPAPAQVAAGQVAVPQQDVEDGMPRRRRTDATQALPLTGPEEEKLHAAAKRFAKLLVSEIKLYNENTVAEGRKTRDIYARLHRDIDRSRDMYEKRVASTVASKVDYFHDEIVRILGDNDADTLGGGYPGPRLGH
ncbi:MAG: hypothetical protein LBT74_08740 [Acidobacteriota bacterium]|nr:hypothetical protein [Acidobacteriota bacterium]